MDLGNLKVYLTLETTSYDTMLAQYREKTFKFGEDIQRRMSQINLSLKPSVDDRELTKLNAHLDLKQRHFKEVQRYFQSNPLKPSVNLQDLERLSTELKKVASLYQKVSGLKGSSAGVAAASKGTTVNINFDLSKLEKAISNIGKKGFGGTLASIITAPFKLALNGLGSIFTGVFEGIGTPLGKEIGTEFKKGFESEFGDIVGSFRLIAKTFGKDLSKEIRTVIGQDIEVIKKIFEDLLGKTNIVRESVAKRYDERAERTTTGRKASEQTEVEVKFVARNMEEIKRRAGKVDERQQKYTVKKEILNENIQKHSKKLGLENLEGQVSELSSERDSVLAKLKEGGISDAESNAYVNQIKKIAEKISNLNIAIASIQKTSAETFRKYSDLLAEEADAIYQEKSSLERLTASVDNSSFVKPSSAYKKITPTKKRPSDSPDVYRGIVSDVASASGLQVSSEDIPTLKVNNKLPKGMMATYSPQENSINVPKKTYDNISSGKLSNEELETLIHELRHAVQFGFGKNNDEKPAVELIVPTASEEKKFGRMIEYSTKNTTGNTSEYARKVEADAYIFANKNLPDIKEKLEKRSSMNEFLETVGMGGGRTSQKLIQAQMLATKKVGDVSSNSELNVSDETSEVFSNFEKIRSELESKIPSLAEIELLPVDEIKALQDSISKSLDQAIAQTLAETRSFIIAVEQKPERVKSQIEDLTKGFSKKKDLVPIAEELGIEGANKWSKQRLIDQISNSDNPQKAHDLVLETSRRKAQQQLLRQERLAEIANTTGRVVGAVGNGLGVAANTGKNILQSTPVQFAGQIGSSVYGGFQAAERTALNILPGGHTSKELLKQTVAPAATFGLATHMLPGGQAIAEGMNALTSGAIHPLLGAGADAMSGGASSFIQQNIPNVMGLQGSLSGAVTEAITSVSGIVADIAASGAAMIAGGKAIEATVSSVIPKNKNSQKALPGSSQKSLPGSSSEIVEASEEVKATAINSAKEIAKKFALTYKSLKEALKNNDKELSVKLAKIIQEMSSSALSEISSMTASAGESGTMGSEAANKLAQSKSLISRYKNEATRTLGRPDLQETIKTIDVTTLPSSIDPAQILKDLEKEITEKLKSSAEGSLEGFDGELFAFDDILNVFRELNERVKKGSARLKGELDPDEDPEIVGQNASKSGNDNYEKFKRAEREINSRSTSSEIPELNGNETLGSRFQMVAKVYGGEALEKMGEAFEAIKAKGGGALGMLTKFAALSFLAPLFNQLFESSTQVAIEFERLETAINFGSGGEFQGAANIETLNEAVGKYNVNLREAYEGYQRLLSASKGTSLESHVNDINDSLLQASSVYQLSADAQKRLFLATEQVVSKGTVSSEEIRQQMSEALPGSYQIASRSMGMSPAQFSAALKTGSVQSTDFLPKFAQQLKAETANYAPAAANTTSAKQTRFENAGLEVQKSIGDKLLPLKGLQLEAMTKGLELMRPVVETVIKLIQYFSLTLGIKGVLALKAFTLSSLSAMGGLKGLQSSLIVTAKQVGFFIGKFLVFTAIADLVGMMVNSFKDASGGIKEFAESAKANLADYELSVSKASKTTSKLPKSRDGIKGKGYLGEGFFGGAINTVFGEGSTDKAEGFLRGMGSGRVGSAFGTMSGMMLGNPITSGLTSSVTSRLLSRPEKVLNDTVSTTNDALSVSASTIEAIDSQLSNVNSELNQLAEIDKELANIQGLKVATDPTDNKRLRELQLQEDALVKKREAPLEPVSKLSRNIASEIEGLEATLKVYDELAATGGIDQSTYTTQSDKLKTAIKKAKEQQELLNKAIKDGIDQVGLLAIALTKVQAKLKDATTTIEIDSKIKQTGITEGELTGVTSEVEAGIKRSVNAQEELNLKIGAYNESLRETQTILNNPMIQETLKNFGLVGAGSEKIRAVINERKITQNGFEDSKEGKLLETAADSIEQINEARSQTADFQNQVSEQKLETMKSMKDLSKSLADFYRSAARQAEDLTSEAQSMRVDTAISDAQNKLQQHIKGFAGKFFGDLISNLTELIDVLYEPMKNKMNLESQIRGYRRTLEDQIQSQNDLLSPMSAGGNASSGGAIRSGLYTAPESNNGGSSAYHIDTKFNRNLPTEQIVGMFDQLAAGYRQQGRKIEFSNPSVAGEVYDETAPLAEKMSLLTRAMDAHSHSVSEAFHSLDYYIPTVSENRFGTSAENAEMLVPTVPGISLEYGSGGNYGNYLAGVDSRGEVLFKQGHGDDSRDLPSNRTVSEQSPTRQETQTSNSQMSSLNGVDANKIADLVQYYMQQGLSKAGASYLVGNLVQESSLDPQRRPDTGEDALGLAQWHPDRRQGMPSDYEGQRAFVLEEMRRDSPDSLATLQAPNASVDAIKEALKNWERYGVEGNRYQYGAEIYSNMGGTQSRATGTSAGGVRVNPAIAEAGTGLVRQGTDAAIDAAIEQAGSIDRATAIKLRQTQERVIRSSEESVRSLEQTRIDGQREIEDLQLQNLPPTARNELNSQLVQLDREEQDSTRQLKLDIRDARDGIAQVEAIIGELESLSASQPELRNIIPSLSADLEKSKAELAKLETLNAGYAEAFADRRMNLANEAKRADDNRAFEVRSETEGMRSSLNQSQIEIMNRNGNGGEALSRQYDTEVSQINLEYDSAMRAADEKLRLEQMTTEEYETQKSILEQIREANLNLANERAIDAETARSREEMRFSHGSKMDLANENLRSSSMWGIDTPETQAVQRELATADQWMNFEDTMTGIDELGERLGLTAERITELKDRAIELNDVKLDNIKNEFSLMNEIVPGLKSSFQGLFSGLITGSQSFGEVIGGFFKSIADQFADLASKYLTNELFSMILGIGGGGKAASVGESTHSGFLGVAGGLFTAATGGEVPSMSMGSLRERDDVIGRALRKEGSNSILAALTPGERVLTVAENRIFEARRLDKMLEVQNFKTGGVVASSTNFSAANSFGSSTNITVPFTYQGGDSGGSDLNKEAVSKSLEAAMGDWAIRNSRPGGILHNNKRF